jgi:multidrug efflux pump subunit AcrA (membrane-fusion protein)
MTPTSSRHHRLLALGAAAAVLLAGLALGGCSTRAAAAPAAEAAPIAVTTAPVALTDVASAIEAGGIVQARTTATIAARILAPVREVRVSPGDQVRKGQTLIVLDGADLAAGARAARSAALAAEQGPKAAAAELQAAEAACRARAEAPARRASALRKAAVASSNSWAVAERLACSWAMRS